MASFPQKLVFWFYTLFIEIFLPKLPPKHWNKLCAVLYNWGNTCENPQAYTSFYVKADSKALKTALSSHRFSSCLM
jgi:hypothetical protein